MVALLYSQQGHSGRKKAESLKTAFQVEGS